MNNQETQDSDNENQLGPLIETTSDAMSRARGRKIEQSAAQAVPEGQDRTQVIENLIDKELENGSVTFGTEESQR